MFKPHFSSRAIQDVGQRSEASADRNELSIADLDTVSGGINPQPLPPMPRMKS